MDEGKHQCGAAGLAMTPGLFSGVGRSAGGFALVCSKGAAGPMGLWPVSAVIDSELPNPDIHFPVGS